MTVAEATEITHGALLAGLGAGAVFFLIFFVILRVGLIYIILMNRGGLTLFGFIQVIFALLLGWQVYSKVPDLTGDGLAPALILFVPPVALAFMSTIPVLRLGADPRAEEAASLTGLCAAVALAYAGIWYAMFTVLNLQ